MANDWPSRPFETVYAIPSRNGLMRPKKVRGSGIKMVNMGELFAYDRIRNQDMERVPVSDSESERFLLETGDLLFARASLTLEGSGKCSIVYPADEPRTFESHIIRVRLKKTRVSPLFYYYFFKSSLGRSAIQAITDQVSAAGIRASDLAKLPVPCPGKTEQDRLSDLLAKFDDKIELNRRMNRTLEKMAAAIFKCWFIDFDPVHTKAEGRNPNLPSEIADLFPDAFEDSDLGPMPKGWTPGKLADIADNPRRTVKPSDVPPTTPYIGLQHMPRRCIALDAWGRADEVSSGKSKFKEGEILFGKLRPYFHKVGIAPIDGVCSTDILVVVPKSPEWHSYILSLVSSKAFVDYTDSHSAGTKMPRTNWKDMGIYPLALPPKSLVKMFQYYIAAFHQRISLGVRQNRRLAGLRDTLMPKLLSGEIKLPEAEAVAEEVDK